MQHGEEFGEWIHHHPEPKHVRSITEPCPEFVELEVWEREVPKPTVVQGGAVLTGPREPGGECAFAVAKHPYGSANSEPFRQCTQDFRHTCRCGFEAIERCVTPGGERGPTGLTAEGLDALDLAMRAVAHEGMDGGVDDTEIDAGGVRAREAISSDPLGCTSPALAFPPRAGQREWRRCGWR